MNGIRPKQHARIGMFHLEEAVLDVLLEAAYEEKCWGASMISKRAGIFRDRGAVNMINDAIVHGVLVKLSEEGRVERCEQSRNRGGGWLLTRSEFERRRDDVQPQMD